MTPVTTQYKKLQGDVLDSAHKLFLASLGTFKAVGEESGDLFNRMVERGRTVETLGKERFETRRKELKKLTSKVEDRVDDLGERVDKQVTGALHRLGVPSRTEIQTLTRRVEELSRKVDKIAGRPVAAPKTVFHVAPHEDGWKVEAEGAKAPTSLHATKEEALTAARETAKKAEPSQVVVHRMDGTIQTQFGYGDELN